MLKGRKGGQGKKPKRTPRVSERKGEARERERERETCYTYDDIHTMIKKARKTGTDEDTNNYITIST